MADLDISAFEADVVEHVLAGRARARMLEDVRGDQPWNVDLVLGELTLGARAFRVQILGTFASGPRTFLWAWANPGAGSWEASLETVRRLRERSHQRGQAVFGEPEIAADWVNPNELAYVAGEVAGEHPVFVGHYDGGAAFLLVTDASLSLDEFPMTYLPGVLADVATITASDARSCVRRFLERLGFTVAAGNASVQAIRDGNALEVTYDEAGRVASVSLSAKN